MMNDERICGARDEEGHSCLLLPDHPTPSHAGLRADSTMVMWPRVQGNYKPQHALRREREK
jgi:hypothetical protein